MPTRQVTRKDKSGLISPACMSVVSQYLKISIKILSVIDFVCYKLSQEMNTERMLRYK